MKLAETRDNLGVVHDQIGGPTPAHEIANTCSKIATEFGKFPQKSGIYHFSGYPNVSWYEFSKAIIQEANLDLTVFPITTEDYPAPAKRPKNSRLNCSKILNTFGVRRPFWENWIEKILAEIKG